MSQPSTKVLPAPHAWRDFASHGRLWLAGGSALALDLWSKHWAFSSLEPDTGHAVIDGVLEFRRSLNAGAVFGVFSGYVNLFVVASLAALAFVLYMFATSSRSYRVMHLALGLILAGAIGNLYDRTTTTADVVDFRGSSGEWMTFIGRVTSEPTDDFVRVEDWPAGGNPRTLSKDGTVVRTQGVVRDFIRFVPRFPAWVPRLGGRDVWPWVFNVADAALVVGVLTLLAHSLFDRREAEPEEADV